MLGTEAPTPLGLEDARILALESGPIRGHTLKLLIIEDAPGDAVVPALRGEIARRLPSARRWRERLVPAPGTPAGLAWEEDPAFDIARHVRAACADRPVEEGELRRRLADLMAVPLDRTRPLWTVDVIPRLSDGRWAIVWKVHHCLADGVTEMRAGASLLWTEETSAKRAASRPLPAAPGTHAKWVVGARLAKLTSHRGLVLRELRRVRRLSPLAAEVGPDRVVDFAECTLDELRAIRKAIGPGVTVNDVLLAVITGALRRWLQRRGATRARMKVQVPVSMHPHRGDDDPYGNRDSFFFVHLPLDEADPVARVRTLNRATLRRKNRNDARAIDALRETLSHAPASVRRALQRFVQGPNEYSLNVSNVPGPAGPIQVLGHRVDAMYSVTEVAPHHGLRVSAISLNRVLFIGLCADPRVVPDLDVITEGIRLSIDELHERLNPRRGTAERVPLGIMNAGSMGGAALEP